MKTIGLRANKSLENAKHAEFSVYKTHRGLFSALFIW
jgi:hypothetical protein